MSRFKCVDSVWCHNSENGCEHAVEHEYIAACKMSCFGANSKGCVEVIEKVECFFKTDCLTCDKCGHGKPHEKNSECIKIFKCLIGITNCRCVTVKTEVETKNKVDLNTENTPKRLTIYFKEN
jgi:hypothetical protein